MPRLNQVTREFNISLATIKDFLKTNYGFEACSLNDRISDEQYLALAEVFHADKVLHGNAKKKAENQRTKGRSNSYPIARHEAKLAKSGTKLAKIKDKRVKTKYSSTGVPLPTEEAIEEYRKLKRTKRKMYYKNCRGERRKGNSHIFINVCMGGQNKQY